MDSSSVEVAREILPYMRVLKDGTVERLVGTEVVPATLDPETGVLSKDIVIVPETGVAARIYRPNKIPVAHHRKLPLVVYFHGGAFVIASISEPKYHTSLNNLVAESNAVVLSVDYRLAPENPLPAAYEDSRAALKWVASHNSGGGSEAWIRDYVDLGRVFLAGDSAGANIAHHMAIRVGPTGLARDLKIHGLISIHPYFWGEKPIGSEITDPFRKAMVDNWWGFVCPSDKGGDDPLINPFVDGAPSLADLACDRVVVCVAQNDILKDRGELYYQNLVKSSWNGVAEIVSVEDEDHVFHIFNPTCEKAVNMIKSIACFINKE